MAAPAALPRKRWVPSVTAKVNRAHPISTGVVSAYLPIPGLGAIDLVGGQPLGLTGTPNHGITTFGRGMASTVGNDGARLVIGTNGKLSQQPPISLMWVGRFTAAPTPSSVLFGAVYDQADGSPYVCYALDVDGSANTYLRLGGQNSNTGGGYDSATSSITPIVGQDYVIIGVISPTSPPLLFVNGTLASTGGATSWPTLSYSSSSVFGFNWYGTARATNTIANFGAMWNRAFTVSEIQKLYADPFCFLTPSNRIANYSGTPLPSSGSLNSIQVLRATLGLR